MANIPEFISVLRRIRDEIYPEVEAIYKSTATLESQAEQSKISAAASATASASSAATATTKANEIKNVSAQANTLSSGSSATVSYNATDGKFTFGLPVGAKGDKGESYTINATGTTYGRAAYDAQSVGFSYLDITLSIVYFKLSATSGDWSTGTSFGRGEDGADGADGTGITSIAFYSTTSTNGLAAQAGGIDTYRITLSNSNTYDISVINGNDLNINGYENKTIPKDDDEFVIADSDSFYNIKKLSFSNIKASLNTGFKNLIVNGRKQVNQRGLTSTDNSYNYDNHYKVGNNWFMFIEELDIESGSVYTLSWEGAATASYYIGSDGRTTIDAKSFADITNGGTIIPTMTSGQFLWIKFESDSTGSTYNKVQFEKGAIATPFENRSIGLEEMLIERYYEVKDFFAEGYLTNIGNTQQEFTFRTKKRIAPIVSNSSITLVGTANGFAIGSTSTNRVILIVGVSGAGNYAAYGTYYADARP